MSETLASQAPGGGGESYMKRGGMLVIVSFRGQKSLGHAPGGGGGYSLM